MKNVGIVVLIIVIVAALLIGLRAAGIVGTEQAPDDVADMPLEVIDADSLEVREVSIVDWERRYQVDPETGYRVDDEGRKIAIPVTCNSCGEKTPPMAQPEDADQDELDDLELEYECPLCGGLVY